MDAELQDVVEALSGLAETELESLIVAANELVLMAAGLLSWIEHIADWELSRRAGMDIQLMPPGATIRLSEVADSIVAVTMLRDGYQDAGSATRPVVALLDAIVDSIAVGCSAQ